MKTKCIKLSITIFLSVFVISVTCNIKSLSIMQTRHVKAAETDVATVDALVMTPTPAPTEAPPKEITEITYKNEQFLLAKEKPTPTPITPKPEKEEQAYSMIHIFGAKEKPTPVPKEAEPKEASSKETESKGSEPKETVVEEPSYPDVGICIAKDFVNIRKEPSPDGEVQGKLYRNAAAAVLNCKNDWYQIESGDVKGYVKSEYINLEVTDEELIDKYGKVVLTVKTKGVAVREDKSTEAERLDALYKGDTCTVTDIQDDWLEVKVADKDLTGYVKKDYAELSVNFKDAVSIEEEQEAQRREQIENICTTTEITYRQAMNYTDDDLKLLACLVHAEAGGQTYEGKLAVANIVVNRMLSGTFPSTMKGVIYSPSQFSVVNNGSLASLLNNYSNFTSDAHLSSIKAAKAALDGINNMGSRLYFHAYSLAVSKGYHVSKPNCVKIDDQLYW